MLTLKQVAKYCGSYSAAILINKVISGGLVFYNMHVLSSAEVGILSLINNFFSLIFFLFTGALRHIAQFEFFHKTCRDRIRVINDLVSIYLMALLCLLITLSIVCKWVTSIFFNNYTQKSVLFLSAINNFLILLSDFCVSILILYGYYIFAGLLQIISVTINAVLTMYLLSKALCIENILIATFVSNLLVCCVMTVLYYAYNFSTEFDIKRSVGKIRYYVQFSVSLLPSLMMGGIIGWYNRYFLFFLCGLDAVGMYSLVEMANSLLQAIIINPVHSTYIPCLLKNFSENSDAYSQDVVNKKMIMICIVFAVVVVMVSFWAIMRYNFGIVLSHQKKIIPALAITTIAHIFLAGSYCIAAFINFMQYMWIINSAVVGTLVIASIASYFFISYFNVTGAACSILCAYIFYFCALFIGNEITHKKHVQSFKVHV